MTKPPSLRHLAITLLPLLLAGTIKADTPTAAPVIVQARFHCLAVSDGDFKGLSLLEQKAELPLSIPRDFLSPAYDYKGPSDMVVLGPPAAPAPNRPTSTTTPKRAPLLTVTLPPDGGEFLLLFANGSDGKPRTALVNYSMQTAPLGSYLVWNLTARPLSLQLDASHTLLAPGRSQTVTLPEDKNTYMPLKVFDQAHGQVYGARHLHRPQTRQLVFLTDSPGRADHVSLRMITQTVFTPEQPALGKSLAALR